LSREQSPASRWSAAHIVVLSVTLSWGMTIITLLVLQWLPGPWRLRFIHADTISVGGGPGQGSIILSAERALGGRATVTLKGSKSQESLTLSVTTHGSPVLELDSALGTPLMTLDLTPDEQPRIRLMDTDSGKSAWSVTLDANGQPVIENAATTR
jgi:hypothetical protein